MCVCVRERARESVCVRARVFVCVCVCVCERERGKEAEIVYVCERKEESAPKLHVRHVTSISWLQHACLRYSSYTL